MAGERLSRACGGKTTTDTNAAVIPRSHLGGAKGDRERKITPQDVSQSSLGLNLVSIKSRNAARRPPGMVSRC